MAWNGQQSGSTLFVCTLLILNYLSCCGSQADFKKLLRMKKFFFVTAALLTMSVSSVFGQTQEQMTSIFDAMTKLENLCAKQPKITGVGDVDTYVQGVFKAANASIKSSEQLKNLYYRQIGKTEDGVTDVTIKKPSVEELVALGTTLVEEGKSIAEAAKGAEAATKGAGGVKNPLKVTKVASALAFSKDAYPVLAEQAQAKVDAINKMIETAKSASNL